MSTPPRDRRARTIRTAGALRLALLAGLLAALVAGLGREPAEPRALGLAGAPEDVARVAEALVAADPPRAVLRPAGEEPSESELALLEAVGARAPVFAELPAAPASLRVRRPEAPVAGRAATLPFRVAGAPGETVVVRRLGAGDAVVDSVRVGVGDDRVARGAFRVRPDRAGWVEWRLAAGGEVATTSAWVAPAARPRVLLVGGAPSWESRAVARALERSGVELGVVQALGRENVVAGGDAAAPWWGDGLARQDVVILLPGAALPPAAIDALAAHVAAGRGALLAGGAGLAELGLAAGPGDEVTLPPDSLVWSGPAELAPLPGLRGGPAGGGASVAAVALRDPGPAAGVAAASRAGDALLVLGPYGRGRVAGLGLRETWKWPLAYGREAEHRDFWRALVDWLAAPAADAGVRSAPTRAAAPVTVRVEGPPGDDGAAPAVRVRRPHGSTAPTDRSGGRFVAAEPGLHELLLGDRPVAAFLATDDADPPADLARARLALTAAASGGAALEPAAFADRERAEGVERGRLPWAALAFLALVLAAAAEWAVRRFRGLP